MSKIDKAAWIARIAQLDLLVPPNRGALWSGIGKASAREIAIERDLRTLEMTIGGKDLDVGLLKTKLDTEFGVEWTNDKKAVWQIASQRFASRLSGKVTIFLAADMYHLRTNDIKFLEKIVWDEMMDLPLDSPIGSNSGISEVLLLEFDRAGRNVSRHTIPLNKTTH